jgi:hypothetical protein
VLTSVLRGAKYIIMAASLAGDELVRSMSSRRASFRSASKGNWASTSFREVWSGQPDVFQKSGREDDEEELMWAALERLRRMIG